MFKPIKDILDYIKIFEIYLGAKIYIIYFITMVASFLEGFGILLLLPLLQNLDDSQEVDKMDGGINEMLYSFIEFLGFTDSILSILILGIINTKRSLPRMMSIISLCETCL